MYIAIEPFTDLHDNRHGYKPGDVFPRSGLIVSEDRLKELSTSANRRKRAVIALVVESKPAEPQKEDFSKYMNPPEISAETAQETEKEKPKPKRGRKKNADA